jgi:hypothetical protein
MLVSPEIVKRMKREYPDDQDMRISHEAISQYIYVLPRGSLRKTLFTHVLDGKTRKTLFLSVKERVLLQSHFITLPPLL